MTTRSQKYLTTLMVERDHLAGLIHARTALGQFDANSGAILDTMKATLAVINYNIVLAEESKGKAK